MKTAHDLVAEAKSRIQEVAPSAAQKAVLEAYI